MTDCTTQPLFFASVGRRKLSADFHGGYPLQRTFQAILRRLLD